MKCNWSANSYLGGNKTADPILAVDSEVYNCVFLHPKVSKPGRLRTGKHYGKTTS